MLPTPRRNLGLPLTLLPEPFATSSALARREALAATSAPGEAWESFRSARRRSPNVALRGWARMDELYRTEALEKLDRADTTPLRRQQIITALDRFHRRLGTYERLCQLIAPLAATFAQPRLLEIASGHGQLAIALERYLAARGHQAAMTGSDLAPELVELAQQNAARVHSAATFRVLDATRLDVPDDSYDLAVNALAMHHLPFELVVKALTELRRVAKTAVIVDLVRSPLLYAPGGLVVGLLSQNLDCVLDGLLSLRKAWSIEEWRLALELAGWERVRFGVLLPSYLVIHLERGEEG